MPCVCVETGRFGEILDFLPELPPHNWLITGLECYDYCGWDGCEKWGERELFLTDEAFRRDVCLRNMQIIWGVFSAIPAEYSRETVYQYPLPEVEIPYYMSSNIAPQHPLAFLELYVDDGCATLVSAQDAVMLRPLYTLPVKVVDVEADNKILNEQLRRIQDVLRQEVPDVSPEIANQVQWEVWHSLFKDKSGTVKQSLLHAAVMWEYRKELVFPTKYPTIYWDPYTQK